MSDDDGGDAVISPSMIDGSTTTGRVIGIDLGDKRIGIAVSDSNRNSAFARDIIVRTGDVEKDQLALLAAIDESMATAVVVGVPYSLDGSLGPSAKKCLAEIEWLRGACSLVVDTVDERMTTVEATRRRQMANTELKGRKSRASTAHKPGKKPQRVDDLAAEVLLQAYLDRMQTK